MKIAIVGGGAAGLSAAYHLTKNGFHVTILEADPILGGLASWFKIENNFLEKYYHFLCLGDREYIQTAHELGLQKYLHWRYVFMGYFYENKRYNFGTPWDLLLFPHLSFKEKYKFARGILNIKKVPFENWREIADQRVVPWLKNTFGNKVFEVIHAPLISGKFGQYKENLSAAWMWARIHRIGKSRSRYLNLEIYGYLEGGSFRLLQTLADRIRKNQGRIIVQAPVQKIHVKDNKISAVSWKESTETFDAVISTIPFQLLKRILPTHPDPYFQQLDAAEYYGVTCLVLRMKKQLTKHFWLNINDPRIEIPGIIEYTNLNPLTFLNGDKLLYIPQYLDTKDPLFKLTKEEFLNKYIPYLKLIRPDFQEKDILEAYVSKNSHAQPLCDMGFQDRIPSRKTPISGLYVTDSYQLHPDDRTVSSSLKMGRMVAQDLMEDLAVG